MEAGKDLAVSADRRAHERERLIAQLAEADRARVKAMRDQHVEEVRKCRQAQSDSRAEDIRQEREKLLREAAKPELTPDGRTTRPPSAAQADRIAGETVDRRNTNEIVGMAQQRDERIDQFLQEKNLTYDQFKGERESIEATRATVRAGRDQTREL